ncbi:MAG: hypothetical protein HYS06_06450 [Methylocystis sp.]|nr:hypothetical protein [Methylocystis sp.]
MSVRTLIKNSPLAPFAVRVMRLGRRPKPQNEEGEILNSLLAKYDVPELFVEFGFSGWEFNCAHLASTWQGLLIDCDEYNKVVVHALFGRNIEVKTQWLTLDNLNVVAEFVNGRPLGILSIDVDGNDYWFLKRLIHLRPAVIIGEYNAIYGLRPITQPYKPGFDRRIESPDWGYFGASLTALAHLAEQHGYKLAAVTPSGINAFFVRDDLIRDEDALDAAEAFRWKDHGGRTQEEVWVGVAHMPFIDVTGEAHSSDD